MIGLARLSLLFAVLPLAGCIAEVSFDPVGTAASVEGSWTIDGAPASADACRAYGIDYVRVRFYRDERTADHPHLVFPCAQGSFDTRPERIVAEGTWTMGLVAIDAEGDAIALGPEEMVSTAAVGGHIALTPVDFTASARFDPSGTDAALSASWTLGGSTASSQACDAFSASTMEVVLYAADDLGRTVPAVVQAGTPCADGTHESGAPVIAAGTYLVSGVLRDASGEVVATVDVPTPVTVVAGSPLVVAFDFRLEDSRIDLRFLFEQPSSGAPTTCAAAGVAQMTWRLDYVDASGTVTPDVADSGGAVTCTEHVSVARSPLAPGTYRVYFDASATIGGPTLWMVQSACDAVIDAAGGLGVASCEAAYSAP